MMNLLKWNKEFALEQAADDMELLLELIEIFKSSFQNDLKQLEEGLKNNAAEQICSAAHSIKGAAASLGIEGIREVALDIEEDSRTGSVELAQSKLPLLQSLLTELRNL
jgi:HPt (histidine-containing phosphotransfer) domain-containing protein